MSAIIIPITDPEDPRIADYTSVRERDLTGRDGKFIIEGKVTLEVALTRAAHSVESLLLSSTRAETYLPTILDDLPNIPVFVASQSVMDQIAGFPVHRGILACGRKQPERGLSDWLSDYPDIATLAVCVGLSNHDNAGSVFRNAAALGGQGVILDAESCDPLYRKAIRVSAGTALWLPFHHGATPDEIFACLQAQDFHIWTLTPHLEATTLYATSRPRKLAIVLGPEGPGLTEDQIDQGEAIRIPMTGHVDSLNVATSLAIVLSHRLSGH